MAEGVKKSLRHSQIAGLGCDLWILGERVECEACGVQNTGRMTGAGRPGLGGAQAQNCITGSPGLMGPASWGVIPANQILLVSLY